MKLLFQADDFGLTEGVVLGIERCVKSGLIRNTGLFVNMPATNMAVDVISRYPKVCLGLDVNLTAGKPVSNAKDVPCLVGEDGSFLSSGQVIGRGRVTKRVGLITYFEEEPYSYEETYHEVEQQVLRFKALVGRLPSYLHPHSLMTPGTHRVMKEIAEVYGLKYTLDLWNRQGLEQLEVPYATRRGFSWEAQMATDVEGAVCTALPTLQGNKRILLICHPGYVDADLFRHSSFTAIRMRDMEMASSKQLLEVIHRLGIEQITYEDF